MSATAAPGRFWSRLGRPAEAVLELVASGTDLALAALPVTRTVRVGVTGLARAGKTAFLTSIAASLLARPGMRLADLGAGDIPRFDHAAHLAALARDPPRWPARTETTSILALQAEHPREFLPARRTRIEFLDYPGEWLLDLPLLAQSYADWSASALARLSRPEAAPFARDFLRFIESLPARAQADETLARAGTRLYRAALSALRDRGFAFLQPGRHLLAAPGPEPPWVEFFPCRAAGGLGTLLASRFDAYRDATRRDLSAPLFAEIDRLVVLADVLSALHAGPAAFHETQEALAAAAASLRWSHSWMELLGSIAAFRLPPRPIRRVAFLATKADHVAERQRGNLAALMRALTETPGTDVATLYGAIASVRCTEDFVWTLQDRPVSAVRGRIAGQSVLTRSYPGEVPDRPPDPSFWEYPFLALPDFEPLALPQGGRAGVPNLGLDGVITFLLGDVL